MKEIIRHGKIDRYIHTCSKCGCVFTYEPSDFISPNAVRCPDCKAYQSTAKDTKYEKSGEQKTIYTTYKLTRREQEGKESKPCPHFQFNIGSEYCRTCRYFVSHDHVYRTVKCSYPNPSPDIFLEPFKNKSQKQQNNE